MYKGNSLIQAYNQMMLLEYQTKCKKQITIGEALRLLKRAEEKRENICDVRV